VIKRAWCPIRNGYIMPGETIEVPENLIKAYATYVQPVEVAKKASEETAKREPEKKAKKKSGDG